MFRIVDWVRGFDSEVNRLYLDFPDEVDLDDEADMEDRYCAMKRNLGWLAKNAEKFEPFAWVAFEDEYGCNMTGYTPTIVIEYKDTPFYDRTERVDPEVERVQRVIARWIIRWSIKQACEDAGYVVIMNDDTCIDPFELPVAEWLQLCHYVKTNNDSWVDSWALDYLKDASPRSLWNYIRMEMPQYVVPSTDAERELVEHWLKHGEREQRLMAIQWLGRQAALAGGVEAVV